MRDRQDFELVLSAYNQHGYRKGARGIYVYVALARSSGDEYTENTTPNG